MNDKLDVVYQPSDSLTKTIIQDKNEKSLSENRSDIRAMQLASKAYEAMNKADKMSFLPRLNAFGSYLMYDDQIFQD